MKIIPMVNGEGASQQTAAAQLVMRSLVNGRSGPRRAPRRRKAVRARKARAGTATRRKRRKPARLVKGSAAAKRYMASIRRKRRR